MDSIPVFAPPAWPLMIFFLLHFDLNPFVVILVGVTGSTVGRTILSLYMPSVGKKILSRYEDSNLAFLGEQLDKSWIKTFIFVFLYSLSPLSTTALFTAAGLAKSKKHFVLPPFFLGKLISVSLLVYSGQYAAMNFSTVKESMLTPKGLSMSLLGIVAILGFLFIDWKTVLQKKKLSFKFNIFR